MSVNEGRISIGAEKVLSFGLLSARQPDADRRTFSVGAVHRQTISFAEVEVDAVVYVFDPDVPLIQRVRRQLQPLAQLLQLFGTHARPVIPDGDDQFLTGERGADLEQPRTGFAFQSVDDGILDQRLEREMHHFRGFASRVEIFDVPDFVAEAHLLNPDIEADVIQLLPQSNGFFAGLDMNAEQLAEDAYHFRDVPLTVDNGFHLNRFQGVGEKMGIDLAFQRSVLGDFLLGFRHGRTFDIILEFLHHFMNSLIKHPEFILPPAAQIHIEAAHADELNLAGKLDDRLRDAVVQQDHEQYGSSERSESQPQNEVAEQTGRLCHFFLLDGLNDLPVRIRRREEMNVRFFARNRRVKAARAFFQNGFDYSGVQLVDAAWVHLVVGGGINDSPVAVDDDKVAHARLRKFQNLPQRIQADVHQHDAELLLASDLVNNPGDGDDGLVHVRPVKRGMGAEQHDPAVMLEGLDVPRLFRKITGGIIGPVKIGGVEGAVSRINADAVHVLDRHFD